MQSFWALMMCAYYASICYVEAWYQMDLSMLAPINFSLAAIIAALATQLRYRVRS